MSSVVGFDITIPKDNYEDQYELMEKLDKYCSKFVFQLEQGEKTDYLHWQVRMHLMKKITLAGALADLAPHIGGHWSITSNTVHRKNKFNYVMKEQSRVDGPWTDEDYEEPPPMTWQLKQFLQWELFPYQKWMMEKAQQRSMRDIHLIYDPNGNAGKSIFLEYLEYKRIAFEMPPFRAMEDMLQYAHSFKPQSCYVIDMPRGMKKDKLGEFYSGIEVLKNGVTWDKRYSGKKRRMGRPEIFVFTNELPVFELMSKDRWKVFRLTDSREVDHMDVGDLSVPGGGQAACNNPGTDFLIAPTEVTEVTEAGGDDHLW